MSGEKKITTINKTLLTTLMMDGFWERWIAHGVNAKDLEKVRSQFTNLNSWNNSWEGLALEKAKNAKNLENLGKIAEAECQFRLSSLYYNLSQWIYPNRQPEKVKWFNDLLQMTRVADQLSDMQTVYGGLEVDGQLCEGRNRIPENPIAVIIIINPIDSSKEELFTYETDFIENGFITISFDGPGQGQTYTLNGFKATTDRWTTFVDKLIEYADTTFPGLPINLFGTSSGASWAIYGSQNELVHKTVAVSPAIKLIEEKIQLPDYFTERMNEVMEEGEQILPSLDQLTYKNPLLLFHGNQDVMIPNREMYRFYHSVPVEKDLIEYKVEGHCCNNKLSEVRKRAMQWFLKG